MTTVQQTPDEKIVDRVRKLLAKANDAGVTEAEASAFAAKAAAIMEEHGLDVLRVERSGGEGEAREKAEKSSAFGAWYGPLMRAVAESCFVHASVLESRSNKRVYFDLIGRRSAVASAQVLYDYLREAIWRLSREAENEASVTAPEIVFSARYFRHGCAERVTARLRERHAARLREQREQAEREQRERAAASSHPSAAPAGTALVVTLVDHEQRERDLNEDFRRGVPPGTTEREREESQRREAEQERRFAEVEREHGWGVAWWMVVMGRSLEEALEKERAAQARRAAADASKKEETEAQRQRREERDAREWAKERERAERAQAKELAKRRSPAFRAGLVAGDKVGLDQQIGEGQKGRASARPDARRLEKE